ncbi:MAG: hypothetical protein HQK56_14715 [Deltaproteobacteria bacterium]|nr:hypothetical protein [Deltaproteobacteria bacterium]
MAGDTIKIVWPGNSFSTTAAETTGTSGRGPIFFMGPIAHFAPDPVFFSLAFFLVAIFLVVAPRHEGGAANLTMSFNKNSPGHTVILFG